MERPHGTLLLQFHPILAILCEGILSHGGLQAITFHDNRFFNTRYGTFKY